MDRRKGKRISGRIEESGRIAGRMVEGKRIAGRIEEGGKDIRADKRKGKGY